LEGRPLLDNAARRLGALQNPVRGWLHNRSVVSRPNPIGLMRFGRI
jgi:hypothetical protein